jgi:hypothetical protein
MVIKFQLKEKEEDTFCAFLNLFKPKIKLYKGLMNVKRRVLPFKSLVDDSV